MSLWKQQFPMMIFSDMCIWGVICIAIAFIKYFKIHHIMAKLYCKFTSIPWWTVISYIARKLERTWVFLSRCILFINLFHMKIHIRNRTTSNLRKNLINYESEPRKKGKVRGTALLSCCSSVIGRSTPLPTSLTLPISSIGQRKPSLESVNRIKMDAKCILSNLAVSCPIWCLYDSKKEKFLGFRE